MHERFMGIGSSRWKGSRSSISDLCLLPTISRKSSQIPNNLSDHNIELNRPKQNFNRYKIKFSCLQPRAEICLS
jgi:hypothetical protein